MGLYLVSVGAEEWFGAEEGEYGETASALNEELRRRGLPPYASLPEESDFVPGAGLRFEEKLSPSMAGFGALCEAHLARDEGETLAGWSVLVPFSLEDDVRLSVGSAYADETLVAGAPQVLALAERLAVALELPVDAIPERCDNLELTLWFLDGPAKELATTRPGPWSEDLATSYYVALYLRAAQHSLRRGCPLVYS
ncbi:hypothetical protein ACFV0T_03985 [Streptomyces sp. NPDC059582]|uniref:hypothetical protein n=1 Tax=Streptomyces sp. NPDC059582 TaxID=3346875 RepID=UPI0036B083A0